MTREGIFKDYHDFLGLKEALGFDPMPYTFYLKPFLEYCIEMYPEESNITKEMVDGWLQIRMFRTNATQSHAISNLRAFSRYINSLGRLAYIPSEEYSVPVRRYQPYVFTDYELHTLFNSIDSLAPCSSAPGREFIVPMLFRMMYCCGLRPSEPLHLLTEDINLESGSIYIRQSKMSKDRHIIMSEDLLILCRKYDSMMGIRQWFFQKWDGGPFPTYWMTNQFRICWRNSGLEKHGNPRPYDLRYPNSNKIQTFQKNYRDCNKYHPKRFGFYFYHFFLTPQKATSEPSVFFHFTDTFLSFSSSSVASAFAFSSVVMSR